MKVIGYVRVSTADQAAEGVSLDAQTARIAAWCATQGATLDPGAVHVDAGLSGKRADNRCGLQAALAAVCAQPGAVLVVYSLSRLARSVRDTLAIAERLDRAGADLVSLSERIDTTTASGKMVFRMLAVLAEFERDIIAERTRTALGHKRARSERVGQVPYGRRLAADGRTLEPDPAEVRVLADVRRMRAAGWSLRGIAGELTRRGVPPKNGGPKWTHTSITQILNREAIPHDDHETTTATPDADGTGAGPGEAQPELSVA